MNLMHQHAEAIRVMEECYSFVFWVQLHNQARLFDPRLLVDYLRILGLLPSKGNSGILKRRQRMLEILCSDVEKSSPYYNIYTSLYPMHELSNHLQTTFPEYNWTALHEVHRLRDDAIPNVRLTTHVLPYVMMAIAVLPLVWDPEQRSATALLAWLRPWSWESLLDAFRGIAVLYLPGILSLFLWSSCRTRYRSRRAGSIFSYLAARHRALSLRTGTEERGYAPDPFPPSTRSVPTWEQDAR